MISSFQLASWQPSFSDLDFFLLCVLCVWAVNVTRRTQKPKNQEPITRPAQPAVLRLTIPYAEEECQRPVDSSAEHTDRGAEQPADDPGICNPRLGLSREMVGQHRQILHRRRFGCSGPPVEIADPAGRARGELPPAD